MCLDCYPDRCFTYACKNASHRTAVPVPAWCCTVRRDLWSEHFPLQPVLAAQLCFPHSSSVFSLCHTSSSPGYQEGDYRRIVTLLHPIPQLSPPSLHFTVLVMTTHLPWPNPHPLFVFPLLIFSSSFSPPPTYLSTITTPTLPLSLPLRRDQCRIVLCCDIESCIR